MLRAILFDFSGVLVDDEPLHRELLREVLTQEGLEIGDVPDLGVPDLDTPDLDDRARFTAALEAAGRAAAPDLLSRLTARLAAYRQLRIARDGYPVPEGAIELVEAAAAAGMRLGVVSGALREEIEAALERIGVRRHFKAVVSAENVAEGKPSPEGYRRGLELLNALPPLPRRLLHPHEVLAIEDSPVGLRAAAAAGLLTLGVARTRPAAALADADHVTPSLADVSLGRIRQLFDR